MNRYKVVRFIGRGGMGAVYLCEDLRLSGKQWAIKEMILPDSGLTDQIRDSFEREAHFLASLRHRALPVIVDIFFLHERHYLVMEYLQGSTLSQYIERHGIPNDSIALSWALELAQVLDYLHRQEQPVIFRDLKPENIIITDDGHIKLIDFGLARTFEPSKRRDTQASGTVGYAPPEQWDDSGQSDARSDIYSLAATLYFILTGKPPSPVYGTHNLRAVRPDIDPDIEALVLRCLQTDPNKRYHTAAELIKDLLVLVSQKRHQDALQKSLAPPSPLPELRRARTRMPYRLAPLRLPVNNSEPLPYLLGLGLILWLVGCLIPFVTWTPSYTNSNDPIAELLQETEPGKAQAKAFLEKRQYQQAIAILDELATRYPQDAELHILKSNAYAAMSGQPLLTIPVISSWKGIEREGFQLLYGFALAQIQLNRNRLGQKPLIELKLYNDESNSEHLLKTVQELASDPKVSLLLGPYTSQASRLIAPVINARGLPTITPTASDPHILSTGRYLLCASDTDTKKVQALAQKFFHSGYRSVAVYTNESSILSRSLAEEFMTTFQDLGGHVVCDEAYPANQLDFTQQVQRAKERQAQAIFVADYRTQPVIGFCQTLKAQGLTLAIAAQTPGFASNLFRDNPKIVDGLFLSTYYVPEGGNSQNRVFVQQFRQTFGGRSPSHREAQAYDSLLLAVQALDSVGPNREKLLTYFDALGVTTPAYQGVSGQFALAKALNLRKPHILQVQNGTYNIVN